MANLIVKNHRNWRKIQASDAIGFTDSIASIVTGGLDSRAGDEAALEALYTSTNGASWDNNTGWASSGMSLADAESGNMHGIEVDTIGGELRVTRIELVNNSLTGNINITEWQNFKQCLYLDVRGNDIGGNLPSSFDGMTSMTHLLLNHDKWDDETLEATSDLHPGKSFDVARRSNDFTGTLPPEWGSLSNLEWLLLDGTSITGTIPSEWGGFSSLIALHLTFNPNLEGPLPSELGNLTELRHFSIGQDGQIDEGFDGFAGTSIPSTLSNWTNLRYVRIKEIELSGNLDMFSNSTELRVAFLEGNAFTGELPSFFGEARFGDLSTLYLSWNNFTGSIFSFENRTDMFDFQFNGLQITGSLPTGLTDLGNVIILTFGWNDGLGGELPQTGWSSFSNQLRSVRFNNTSITGHIPGAMISVMDNPDLQTLACSNADFTSCDIQAVENMTSSGSVYLSGNRLTPKDLCLDDGTIPSNVSGYGSQGNFDTEETISAGTLIDFSEYDHPGNSYSWYRSTDSGSSFSVISGEITTSYDTTGEASGNIIRMDIDHASFAQTFLSNEKTIS